MCADDPSIADETVLYRRVPRRWIVPDNNRQPPCVRLSTGAFQGMELSVGLGDELEALGEPPEAILTGLPEDMCLVGFPAAGARALDQLVCRDPQDNELAHGLVVGKKTDRVQRELARASSWVVAPDGACEPPYV